MKKIFKLIILSIFVTFASCTTEPKDPVAVANSFTLSKDETVVNSAILTPLNESSTFGKYDWDISDNGASTVSSYSLVVFDHDNDLDLKNPIEYTGNGLSVSIDSRTATLTNKEFNKLINSLPTFTCGPMKIDVRIKSSIGANPKLAFTQYSSPVTYNITGYSTKTPELRFTDGTNTVLLSSSSYYTLADFEGYFYLKVGSYKFNQPDGCGSYNNLIALGGLAGNLSTSAPAIPITADGYYYIKADLVANTYSVKQYSSFGVIGAATRSGLGTNNFCPMAPISINGNIWAITINLIPGKKFKFRNALWTGNPTTPSPTTVPGSNPPTTVQNPSFIPSSNVTVLNTLGKSLISAELIYEDSANPTATEITATGSYTNDFNRKSYTLTVDVTNPRAYTYILKAN